MTEGRGAITDHKPAVILLASRTSTVEHAVERLKPEVLGIIVSQQILMDIVVKCREYDGRGIGFLFRIVDSPMEIGDAFERFEHLLSELAEMGYGPEHTLLDVSGGTTPMRIGVALAAMTRNIAMVHQRVPQRWVNGRWDLVDSGEVEIAPMENPLEATGLLREGQAVELFNRRDYAAAALVLEDVAAKVSGVARTYYYGGLLQLAEGYAAWDVADYGTALEKLRGAREKLGVGFADDALTERAAALVERIKANLSFLGSMRGRLSVDNVIDMVENARRRIVDQGRYDDGVARLYRAVEMWHQWRLEDRCSISTKGVDWNKVDENARERFMEEAGLAELPDVLDLTRARILDRILISGVAEDDSVLRNLLRERNSSILAHGLQPISEASAKTFLEYVDAVVNEPEVRERAEHARLVEL